MTLVEALTIVVILGIVLFVTIPHLTQMHTSSDLVAMKAKAIQFNAAKDAYIAAQGMDQAQNTWQNRNAAVLLPNSTARYQLISPYLPAGANPSSNVLADYVVNGYTICFTQDATNANQSSSLINVAAPVIVKIYSGGAAGTTPIVY